MTTTAHTGHAVVSRPRLRGWLHAAMVPLALASAWTLWRTAPSEGASRLPVLVFGVCLVGLYATSSLYHVPPWGARVRRILSRCDRAMIQLFIMATFTPIAFHTLSGSWRMWSLLIAWLVGIVGAVLAALPLSASRWIPTLKNASPWVPALSYVGVGWLLVVPFTKIIDALPWEGSALIVLGGLLYTIGAFIYAKRWPDPSPRWFGFHEIFHLLVIAGSTAHYVAVWRYVLPGAS
ncbi:MAG: PAQR family membrane homeostasis protein TrhA [Egibacteraceae bacterium]